MTQKPPGGQPLSIPAKAYLREMLELNPMWQSPEILRRRREIWQGNAGASNPGVGDTTPGKKTINPQADARLRSRAEQSLQVLREQFYQLSGEKLATHLKHLRSDRLPEYAATASHLAKVATLRSTLAEVCQKYGDKKFTYSLCEGLIATPGESGALREQYIESIIDEQRVQPACESIQKFVQQYPAIYEVERAWFDLFLDPANQKQWASAHSLQVHVKRSTGTSIAMIGGAVCVLAGILAGVMSPADKPSRPRLTPAPQHRFKPNEARTPMQESDFTLQALAREIDEMNSRNPSSMPTQGFSPPQSPSVEYQPRLLNSGESSHYLTPSERMGEMQKKAQEAMGIPPSLQPRFSAPPSPPQFPRFNLNPGGF